MISLGQQSQLGIGIAIKLQDQFSGTAATVLGNLNKLKSSANQAVLGAMRTQRNFAAGIAAAAGAASYAMIGMAKTGAEFQHTINKTAIIGGKALGVSRKELSSFALAMSRVYTQTPNEVALAMYENVKAGVTNHLKEITDYQLAVATATGEKLDGPGGVAEKLLGIMNAMDIAPSKFGDIANSITAVANATISNVYDIGEAMQYSAFSAKTFNIPLETTLALVGKLSQAKITGSIAGTGINNMLLQLARTLGPLATKRSHKIWAMLGLDESKMRDFANSGQINEVIMAISKATQGMEPITRNDLISQLFNRRGDRAIEGMFDTKHGNVSIASLVEAAKRAEQGNTVMTLSRRMMNDLSGDMQHFANALTAFKIAATESLGPILRVMIHAGTKMVGLFTAIVKTPIGKIFGGLAMVVVPLVGTLFALRAAALTAAIAINGFSASSRIGGFRQMFGAGMDMYSSGRLAASGIAINKAGRAYVAAGQTVNIGGKLYKGGQILPGGFQAMGAGSGFGSKIGNFLGFSALGSGMGWGSKIAGFASKALPWLGKIVGFGFKWLPVVGWIWTIVDLLNDIFGIFKKEEQDPVKEYYKAAISNRTIGQYFPENKLSTPYVSWQEKMGGHDKILQTLQINIDGKKAMDEQIQHKLEQNVNDQLNFNIVH